MSSPSLDRRQLVILLGSGTAAMMGTTAGAASESDDDDDSEEVGDISGTVSDEDETPLEDATVGVFDEDGDGPIAETVTDEDGEYELTEIETGTYDVEAAKSEYETETAEATVEADSTTELSFELVADEQDQGEDEDEDEDETGTITGEVVDEDETALEDVTVELFDGAEDDGEDELIAETTTDENGEYELTEIEIGTYEIEAVTSDYEIGIDEVTVEADSTTELSFELVADVEETGTITGETVDQDATPLEDSIIEVIDGGEIIAETTTDEDGDYELTDVPTGTHEVDAVQSGYEVGTNEITVEADTTHDVSFMLVEEGTDDDDTSDEPDEPAEPTARVSVSTASATVRQQVRFTADDSEAPTGTIESFRWELGDGQTDAGETVTHRYETAGEYTVELTVVTDQDETDTTRETIVVEETAQPDDGSDDDPVEVEVPGFGIGSAVASIGGAGYVIKQRLGSDQKE